MGVKKRICKLVGRVRICVAMCISFANLHAQNIQSIQLDVKNAIDQKERAHLADYLSHLYGRTCNESSLNEATLQLSNLGRYKEISCFYEKLNDSPDSDLKCVVQRQPTVRQIRITGFPYALLEQDLRKRLTLQKGQIFDIDSPQGQSEVDALKATVRSYLQRQGYYRAEIDVESTPVKHSSYVDVEVVVRGGSFLLVDHVEVTKDIPISPKIVERLFKRLCLNFRYAFDAFAQGTSACYSKDRELEAVRYLQDRIDSLGYVQSSIRVRRELVDPKSNKSPSYCKNHYGTEPRCIRLAVDIDKGPKLVTEIRVNHGQTATLNSASRFFRNISGLEFFSRSADSSFVGNPYPADETVLLDELEDALTFKNARRFDEAEVANSINNLRYVLAQRGYNSAQIESVRVSSSPTLVRLRFIIDPGVPSRIGQVRFDGWPLETSEQEQLLQDLHAKPRRRNDSGHFSPIDLAADEQRVKVFLESKGFYNVKVDARAVYETNTDVELVYSIQQNGRRVVQDFVFENDLPEVTEKMLSGLSNCENAKAKDSAAPNKCSGSTFFPNRVSDDKERLIQFYQNQGYFDVDITSTMGEEKDGAHILFHFKNKPVRSIFAGVLVDGNHTTETNAIIYQIGQKLLRPGVPLIPDAIDEGISRLRTGNLFSRIKYEYQLAPDDPLKRYLLIDVAERPFTMIDTAVSFSTDNFFAFDLELHDANFLGFMLELHTNLSLGLFWGRQTTLENKVRWPSFFGVPINLELKLPYVLYEDRPQKKTPEKHFQMNLETSATFPISSVLSPYLKFFIRLDKWEEPYQFVSFINDPLHSIKTIDGLASVLRVDSTTNAVLEPGVFLLDVDNPFDPRFGVRANGFLQFSTNLYGNGKPFVVLGGTAAHYYSFGSFTIASQAAFRRALIEDPQHNWWVLKFQSDMDTLGGDVGLRGYGEGSVGIIGPEYDNRGKENPSKLIPHPGNLSLQGNLELRFPLIRQVLIGDLFGALFSDVGVIGVCEGLFGCEPLFADQLRFGVSVGVGLRYVLPVGPVTLDYAISPIRQGDGPFNRQARFHFSFGFPF